nr:helicase-related protein [Candidatus Sigynarchaeota archaeon]
MAFSISLAAAGCKMTMDQPLYALKDTITPRIYQQRIFVSCTAGNALVVLPTGLGKTLIAAMLAIHELNKHPGTKIVFLAPTKPLVLQHVKSFTECTTIEPERLNYFTGATNATKRVAAWARSTVCFMTPQTFQNDINNGLYPIDDVSLLILDEAHHAVGDYAYCAIAKIYKERATNPRILAITASPGATLEKINEIKQNLYIDVVEARDEKDPDVQSYFYETSIEWKHIDLPAEFLAIKKSLDEELDKVVQFVKEKKLVEKDKAKFINRSQLLEVNRKIQERLKQVRDPGEKQDLFSILKILAVGLRLSYALELVQTQGTVALSKYLTDCEEEARKPDSSSALRIFINLLIDKGIVSSVDALVKKGIIHPKISILTSIVANFVKEHQDSRALVFVNYRVSVDMIAKELKDRGIEKVEKFVGQQTTGRKKGMSQKEQTEILDQFHAGSIQVLVATSVAEEGLDIGEVDLVVFYDMVPSAIRSIQRRGRTGRKRRGKVIVLIANNTMDEAYYYAEKAKE